jgi:hypothetical protein
MNENSGFSNQGILQKRNIAIGLVTCFAISLIVAIVWFRSGPQWQLSIDNTNDATVFTITTTDSTSHVYEVRVNEMSSDNQIHNLTRSACENGKIARIKTLFYDETLKPGRWTVQIDDLKLDIMEARLTVNDKIDCLPGGNLELNKDHI